ncbi:fibronectin type III-like domain-containing protein [Sarocladium implicatum]|nr:fibronectin type III-like domain-containing protein [Sarocladium implicatum]
MGSTAYQLPASKGLPIEALSSLLRGLDFWHTPENQALGLGSLRFSDGPNGVRGEDWVNGAPSLAIPCATALGASFDKKLVYKAAELLASECHVKGAHALLAPTMNIHRYALCGRNFETFSEDPYLTGVLASEYVKGLQKHGIAAAPKHFLANEAENGRRWSNSVIDQRALLNGSFCSESANLLGVLRNEWGFSGVVISDWFGTYSTSSALNAGLDLELPGPSKFRTPALLREALSKGLVSRHQLESAASRVIQLLERTDRIGSPGQAAPAKKAREDYVKDEEAERFLVKAAESTIVLLKNDQQALPMPSHTSSRIGVFGGHAKTPSLFGGGSASLKVPESTPSVWDAVSSHFPSSLFSAGVQVSRLVQTPATQGLSLGPITLDWYNGPEVTPGQLFMSDTIKDTLYMLVEGAPEGLVDKSDFCTCMNFTFVPQETASFDVSIAGPGDALCTINGKVELDVKRTPEAVSTEDYLFDRSKLEVRCKESVLLQAGTAYEFRVTSWSSKHKAENVNREFFIQGCCFGLEPTQDDDAVISQARLAASTLDHAIIVVGTGPEWESEGFDRVDMQLPRRQNELIRAVARACPGRTTVVVNAGSPIDMSSWIKDVDAVLHAWFPGMGFADALLNILVGKAVPSARLPTTFWDKVRDYPAGHVEALMTPDKDIDYREGIYVGYRSSSTRNSGRCLAPNPPRFSFAHGLSYTTFDYQIAGGRYVETNLLVPLEVEVQLQNTGSHPGSETVLLFLQPLTPGQQRPEVELVAFDKTRHLGPGEAQSVHLRVSKRSVAY